MKEDELLQPSTFFQASRTTTRTRKSEAQIGIGSNTTLWLGDRCREPPVEGVILRSLLMSWTSLFELNCVLYRVYLFKERR